MILKPHFAPSAFIKNIFSENAFDDLCKSGRDFEVRVVASIGDERRGKAGSADAGGYRGVLLIKDAGNVEHRNAAVGQVGKDAKRNRFGSLMVSTPGFQRAGQRLCIAGGALGSDGGVRFRGKRTLAGEQRQRLPPVHEGRNTLIAKPLSPGAIALG